MLLVNPNSGAISASISIKRYDGTNPVQDYEVSVPAHGMWEEDVCAKDRANVYGVVTASPETANSIYGVVVREGENDQYRFPTPLRQ